MNATPTSIIPSMVRINHDAAMNNEQKTKGEPYKIKRTDTTGDGYGGQKGSEKNNEGYRHARSVIKISNPRKKGGHPTQKPVDLLEWLIKSYTNEFFS